jgi:hypothetical protein
MLKERFPFLCSISMRPTGKKSLKKILCFVTVCIILHNFLVGKREDDLDEVGDDLSEIDANNELSCPVADYLDLVTCREQVKNYVLENNY